MTEREHFEFKDLLGSLDNQFVQDGWVTMCDLGSDKKNGTDFMIYSYLVSNTQLKKEKVDSDWSITLGSEGKPSIIGSMGKNKTMRYRYFTLEDKGIEPILFYRSFTIGSDKVQYFDISEEYILYYNLYETGVSQQVRTYHKIDSLGELEDVIRIKNDVIQFKQRYLLEYLKVRKMNLILTFDFMRMSDSTLGTLGVAPKEIDIPGKDFLYNHFIRQIGQSQSWIRGKKWIAYDKKTEPKYPFDPEEQYEDFVIGHHENGSEKLMSCKRTDSNYFIMTYFKKEVLDKYYNNPRKYKVDGWHISCPYFTLKIDNHIENYIPVFLRELSSLPHKEQLHWKQYNIPPKKGMSPQYYRTMIEGNWINHPGSIDLFFKSRYKSFNKSWGDKFGWPFYKPLAEEDSHLFDALHLPTTNNVKSFCEQMLTITKLTIDRLNEKKISEGITLDDKDRGITKLEKFLKHKSFEIPDLINFLRNLWNLRSGLFSHTFSNANKDCQKAMEYFGITDINYVEVAKTIFERSLNTLNTLDRLFITQDDLDDLIIQKS